MKHSAFGFFVFMTLMVYSSIAQADCGKILIIRRPPHRPPPTYHYPPPIQQPIYPTPAPSVNNASPGSGNVVVGNGNIVGNGNVVRPSVNVVTTSGLGLFNEPKQQAFVGWNGKEQILILTTQEESLVGDTAMLSIMPLPGKPLSIKETDVETFKKAYDSLASKLGGVGVMGPVLETKIGAHAIFVWEIDDIDTLENSINSFIAEKYGRDTSARLDEKTVSVIKDYFARGFKYFAFDLILVKEKQTSQKLAIAYHYESDFLYYPIAISQAGGVGESKIEIVAFTVQGQKLTQFGGISPNDIFVLKKATASFSDGEMRSINPDLAKLFGGNGAEGRFFRITGEIDGQAKGGKIGLNKDLIAW